MADDFRVNQVGERYARALFELAEAEKSVDQVRGDLVTLKQSLGESLDLRRLIASPAFSSDDKGKALAAIAERLQLGPLSRKFLGLLAQNRRTALLPMVIAGFTRLYDKARGVIAAEVTTAIELDAAQAEGLAKALSLSLGREPEITRVVDPSILGGVKVRVGSRLFDASLRTRLDSLKFALKRA